MLGYGTLYLIPTPIGDAPPAECLPAPVAGIAAALEVFVVEQPKTARQFLKQLPVARPLREIRMFTLDEHTPPEALAGMLEPLRCGQDLGLLSEAGCPAVADPGAALVRLAHAQGIRVVPLVGPSSILLALMASGLNGQSFAFNGYLPVPAGERDRRIRDLEQESRASGRTQIVMETPYRAQRLLMALANVLEPRTELCVASALTGPAEFIATRGAAEWRSSPPEIAGRPCLFLFLARPMKR